MLCAGNSIPCKRSTWSAVGACWLFFKHQHLPNGYLAREAKQLASLVAGLQYSLSLKLAFCLQDVIDSCAKAAMSFLHKSSDTIADLDTSGVHCSAHIISLHPEQGI